MLVPLSTSAQAQDESEGGSEDALGRAEFVHGRDAYAAGNYEESLVAFSRAYELTGRKALLYNIGLAHDRLRHDAEALAAFEEYLEHVPDSQFRDQVEGRISALRQAEREREQENAAREAAAQEEIERARREAEDARAAALAAEQRAAEQEESKPSLWWIGIIAGVVVVGAAVGIGVAVANRGGESPQFDQSDFGSISMVLGAR